jgi:CheY-like chemotaxis protein
LIVEDEWLIRADMAAAFEDAGWEVEEASTGEGAIECLRNGQSIDLLVTDIQLAGYLNGWDVAEAARGVRDDFPVICLRQSSQSEAVGRRERVPEQAVLRLRGRKNGVRVGAQNEEWRATLRKSPAGRSRALKSPSEALLSETEISQGDGCQLLLAFGDAVAGEGEHLFAQRQLQAFFIAPLFIGPGDMEHGPSRAEGSIDRSELLG